MMMVDTQGFRREQDRSDILGFSWSSGACAPSLDVLDNLQVPSMRQHQVATVGGDGEDNACDLVVTCTHPPEL